jgi:hypothetical protein
MIDKEFTWWDSQGQPHTGPITILAVPLRALLRGVHKCQPFHNEGTLPSRPGRSAVLPHQETVPTGK